MVCPITQGDHKKERQKPPPQKKNKNSVWGVNRHFQAKLFKFKYQHLAYIYYRNYCIESNQILYSDKYHQILVVGEPNMHIKNCKMTVVRHLNKQLSYRRGTARRLKSVEILSSAAQLHEKSHLTRSIALSCDIKISPVGSDGQTDRLTTPNTALAQLRRAKTISSTGPTC